VYSIVVQFAPEVRGQYNPLRKPPAFESPEVWHATLKVLHEAGLYCDVDIPSTGVVGARITRHVERIMAENGLTPPAPLDDSPFWVPLRSHYRQINHVNVGTLALPQSTLNAQGADYGALTKLFDFPSAKLRSPDPARPLICVGMFGRCLRRTIVSHKSQGSELETPWGLSLS
jgi:hypothetical protein